MKKLRLALEWFLNPDHVPLLIGLEKRWFADAGLDVELVEPEEHFEAFSAMQQGDVDIAITEPIHLVQDAVKGAPLVGFARFLHTNGGVMVLERSGVSRPRELAGKRVQYPGAPGPGGVAVVRTMIEADGGVAEGLVPVNEGFYHTNALAEDKADCATLVFYNFEVVEARHRGLEPRLFALKDWGVPDFCQLILVTLPETLAQRSGELRALLSVIRRGIDLVHQDPEEARRIYAARAGADLDEPLTREIFDATVRCFTHDLSMSQDYYDDLATWLVQTGQASEIPTASYWTNVLQFEERGDLTRSAGH